ncbi:MAG TPA: alpha/beta hydrolase [Caulobacteraceae bacterium]|nr:alpha/beta hydrolase [Caulobacteraceae bacterium]
MTIAASLMGCSAATAVNVLQPKDGVAATRDIAYGPGPRGRLDVYRPADANGRAPVVVFIYGGGWDHGVKADYVFVGEALARQGLVTIIPDYRLYPEVRWPDFLRDNAKAVAWAKTNAAAYGGDPSRIFLMGHSAGAYDAVMLAEDRRWLGEVGLDPRRDLRGVVGLAGPYDFLPLHSASLKAIFGPTDQLADTQPINHVNGEAPPLFLAAGSADTVVEPGNTVRMAAKVRAAGGQVETRYYSGLSHVLIVGALARPLQFLAPVLNDTADFIHGKTFNAEAPRPSPSP